MLRGFFRRSRPWFVDPYEQPEDAKFEAVGFPTLNPLLWRVIGSKLWQQHEAFDGTYDVGDMLDALEYLDTKAENDRRYQESLAKK